jgi:hypothetical protein
VQFAVRGCEGLFESLYFGFEFGDLGLVVFLLEVLFAMGSTAGPPTPGRQ